MKNDNAKSPKEHSDRKTDTVRKRGSARAPQRAGDGLTCSARNARITLPD